MYNIVKKTVYSTLMIILLLLVSSVCAFAADSKTITLTGGSAEPGDTVTVKVMIDNPQTLAGFSCKIDYDNTKLEVEKSDIINGLSGFSHAENIIEDKSYLRFSAASTKGIDDTDEAMLFSIRFTVKDNAGKGDTTVRISDVFATTDDLVEINLDTKDGVISIKSGSDDSGDGRDNDQKDTPEDNTPEDITPGEESDFEDLSGYDWAKSAIAFLAKNNILKGTGDGTFSPSSNIKRADYVLIIVRMLGLESQQASGNFDDVDAGAYYYDALAIAKAYGYASGTGGNNFNPESEITREDLFVLTYRILVDQNIIDEADDGDEAVLAAFDDDFALSGYARGPMAKLVSMDLIKGSNNMLNPKGKATRAEVAVFVERIYNLLQK